MMANVITGLRILVSAVLVFCPVFYPIFYVLYVTCGLSDMADGIIARKTNSVSDFGSRFDGVADFVFVGVCLIKILPVMDIPIWLYEWTAVIALIKIPLTLSMIPLKYSGSPICFVATFAAVQEGHFIRTGKGIKQKNIPMESGG